MPTDELVTRTPSRRGGPHRVAITEAGLALLETLASEGNDQRTIAKALGLSHTAYRDLIERDDPRVSVQARIDAARPAPRAEKDDGSSAPPSPSVQRLREMLR